jgi:Abortive infection C-terminus
MCDLTNIEKRKLEKLLEMGGGYVLDFSNRTLDQFFEDSIGRSLYDARYSHGSGSKANQMRGFWMVEANHTVGKLMGDMLEHVAETRPGVKDTELYKNSLVIVARLKEGRPVADLDAITSLSDEKDFEAVARAVSSAIESNRPEDALDRLHTFVTKFMRSLCQGHGIPVTREKALHSLAGEYVKKVQELGYVESEMTVRILKSSIGNLEAFNHVRNNQSLAHDNPALNYDEALLIFNNVASSVRFVRSLEAQIDVKKKKKAAEDALLDDDIPF